MLVIASQMRFADAAMPPAFRQRRRDEAPPFRLTALPP
jgi:hypothetical protein